MTFTRLRCTGTRYLLALLCLCHSGWTRAEIYKSVDAEGHVTYSSTPSKGAKKLGLGLPPARSYKSPSPPSDSPYPTRTYDRLSSPADFPRVDSTTQKSRDSMRRKILNDELNAEEKLLNDARASLQQEKAARNGTAIASLQDEVTLHEKNISALKTELARVK
jgi:hypothetical protein